MLKIEFKGMKRGGFYGRIFKLAIWQKTRKD